MNTPAYAAATLGNLATTKGDPKADAEAVVATRPDALFLVNNLGIGGSERKIVRLANRLKDEGVHVIMACLNGPYTIESGLRRDVSCTKLERKGKFSFRTLWQLRQILVRERPATLPNSAILPEGAPAGPSLRLPLRHSRRTHRGCSP